MAMILAAAAAVLAILLLLGSYNRAVSLKHRVESARHQIEVQLARRHDLIPNLVNVVRGAMEHERHLIDTVVKARTEAVSALASGAGSEESIVAEMGLSAALKPILSFVESHPPVTVYGNIISLQEELSSTENRIAFARQNYNDEAARFNAARDQFPASLFLRRAEPARLWAMPDGHGELPAVDLSLHGDKVAA